MQWSDKASAKKFARKMSTGREKQIKTYYTENKILNFFSKNTKFFLIKRFHFAS